MSNPNYTAVLFILDVSGSMGGHFHLMEDAMHMMLEQQARKLAGYITVDVTYFDDDPYWGEADADPMTVHLSMFASGGTSMFDSSATIIDNFEAKVNKMPENEKPGHVVVIFASDGVSEYDITHRARDLPQTTKRLNKAGWDFAFLSAGSASGLQQALPQLGLDKSVAILEPFDEDGMKRMAEQLGQFISMTRSGEKAHF